VRHPRDAVGYVVYRLFGHGLIFAYP
jgi:hypothetical protein